MDADQLYDEVLEAAYRSLRRHNSGARTQMLTRADTIEWHVMRETQARMQPEIDRLLAENEALRDGYAYLPERLSRDQAEHLCILEGSCDRSEQCYGDCDCNPRAQAAWAGLRKRLLAAASKPGADDAQA